MARMTLKRVLTSAAVASLTLLLAGCVSQSDFDAKVKELKSQSEKLSQAQKAQKDAAAKIQALEEEKAKLKEQADKLPKAEQDAAQLRKDLDAAKERPTRGAGGTPRPRSRRWSKPAPT